jgi:hypothetical protein
MAGRTSLVLFACHAWFSGEGVRAPFSIPNWDQKPFDEDLGAEDRPDGAFAQVPIAIL